MAQETEQWVLANRALGLLRDLFPNEVDDEDEGGSDEVGGSDDDDDEGGDSDGDDEGGARASSESTLKLLRQFSNHVNGM